MWCQASWLYHHIHWYNNITISRTKNTKQRQINFLSWLFTFEHDSLAQAGIGVLGLLSTHHFPCLRDKFEDKAMEVRWNPKLTDLISPVALRFKNQIHHGTVFQILVFTFKSEAQRKVSIAYGQFMFSRQACVKLPTKLKQQHWGVQTLSKGLHIPQRLLRTCYFAAALLTWSLYWALSESI